MTRHGHRPWLTGLAVGAAAGLVVAAVATLRDWRLNPGGVFHGPGGTSWPVVAETAWSWFWPVGLAGGALAAALFALLARRR